DGAAEGEKNDALARERLADQPGGGEGQRHGEGRVAEHLPVRIGPHAIHEEERHDGERTPPPPRPARDQVDDARCRREDENGEAARRLDRGPGQREGHGRQVEGAGKGVVHPVGREAVPAAEVGGDLQDRPLVDEADGAEPERELEQHDSRDDREREETVAPPGHVPASFTNRNSSCWPSVTVWCATGWQPSRAAQAMTSSAVWKLLCGVRSWSANRLQPTATGMRVPRPRMRRNASSTKRRKTGNTVTASNAVPPGSVATARQSGPATRNTQR